MLELSIQLGIIFGFNLLMNLVELGVPFIKHAYRVKSEDRKVNSMIQNEEATNVP